MKRSKERNRWMEEMKEAKTLGQVWRIVNKERIRRRKVNENIEMEKWDGYFRGLLRGVVETII